jgi:hypothetical protein
MMSAAGQVGCSTVMDWLDRWVQECPERTWLRDRKGDDSVSRQPAAVANAASSNYSELWEKVERETGFASQPCWRRASRAMLGREPATLSLGM